LQENLWDTIIKTERKAENPRGNSCFYRKFEKGMQLLAAEELEKRETVQQEAVADRKLIRRGVWATWGTATATLIAVILGAFLTYHFSIKNNDAIQLINNHVKTEPVKAISTAKTLNHWNTKND
jgi:hypothetical protein